jgi:hypothetical protein
MTAIVPSDVLYYLAAPSATIGFTTAGTVGNSWGKYMSSTQLSGTALDNLFPDLTGAQNAASQVDYACLFVLNNTSSGNSMLNTVAWLPTSADVAGGCTVSLAGDPAAATVKNSSAQQAALIGSATSAPGGVSGWVSNTGSAPVSPSYTNGIQMGTIAPGFCRALWVRRTATNSTPVNNDGFGIEVDFDTMG